MMILYVLLRKKFQLKRKENENNYKQTVTFNDHMKQFI